MPVHLAGRPCAMDDLMVLARKHRLAVIEDCAHAVDARYKGSNAGTIGDYGVFSFYATKNLVTAEGGMIVSREPERLRRIRMLSLHGLSDDAWGRYSSGAGFKHFLVEEAGYKYNMTDIQASLGIWQLRELEANWAKRQTIWERYNQAFSALPLELPHPVPNDIRHSYHLYQVLVDEKKTEMTRDQFATDLANKNIGVGVHYRSLPEHPYYRTTFGWKAEDFPNALTIGQQTVSLPLSPKMTDQDVSDVIEAVSDLVGRVRATG